MYTQQFQQLKLWRRRFACAERFITVLRDIGYELFTRLRYSPTYLLTY